MTDTGVIFSGCNVENSSYGLTVCAERCAIFTAVAAGFTRFKAIMVTTDVTQSFTSPCGACRQVLSEFGNFKVYCLKPDGDLKVVDVSDLLPFAFTKDELEQGQVKNK